MKRTAYAPAASYFRVATATPEVAIADVTTNIARITALYRQAVDEQVSLVVFPELCITSYSLGDIVRQRSLLTKARDGLLQLAKLTANTQTAMIVGLPFEHNDRLYNCAAVVASGKVRGLVTKTNMPNYAEFYEQRWYQSFTGTTTCKLGNESVYFGQNIIFDIGGVLVGAEICEDIWVANQPSRLLAAAGALIIANPSASPELVSKATYRKDLVKITSAQQRVAYIYSGADWTESTTDIVMSGHCLIYENGSALAERKPFTKQEQLLVADVDIDHLKHDRLQDTATLEATNATIVNCQVTRQQTSCVRAIQTSYFLPSSESTQARKDRLERIFEIQAHGLARRVMAANTQHVVLGLSGGLDSTLALLVACRTATILGKSPHEFIHTLTMPGPASSSRTQDNALLLAKQLSVDAKTVPISDIAACERDALHHDGEQDITYENIQARARTALLFNYANKVGGLVLGTGDLSELVLGWCTFGGDHLSNYNVNGSIPKTLIKDLVMYASILPELSSAKDVLKDIVETPISPELTTASNGQISQKTEDLIGPYILHDFFIFHVLRYGDEPAKIAYLALRAFDGTYSDTEIRKWLKLFYERFAKNQFKRSTLPDGPKVGSVSVSPRGDWRMPSDMQSTLWTDVFAVQ